MTTERDRRRAIVWHAGMYWSYGEPGWLGYVAEIEHGARYLLRHELTFSRVVPELAAPQIIEFQRKNLIENLSGIYAQPSIFPAKGNRGESVAETFWSFGVNLARGTDNSQAAWSRLRSMLQPLKRSDGFVTPTLIVHESCNVLRSSLPALMSEKMRDEVLTSPEEFPARGLAFFAMSQPGLGSVRETDLKARPDAVGHDVESMRRSAARGRR